MNTQEYGRRPYGVGLLVIGQDKQGPHLYEFSPSGNSYEYYAMSIGARSQSAKTYLEKHYEKFMDCTSLLELEIPLLTGPTRSNPHLYIIYRQPRGTHPPRPAQIGRAHV